MKTEISHRLDKTSRLLPGDKVKVAEDASGFEGRSNQSGKCISSVNSSPFLPVSIQFEDGEVVEGCRSDLILTEFYTGAAPQKCPPEA